MNGFEIPDGAVGKDDFFYLLVRSVFMFIVTVAKVAKVLVDSNFIIDSSRLALPLEPLTTLAMTSSGLMPAPN